MIESLVLAVPAALFGLALTFATARVFPALILATFPPNIVPVEIALRPLEPDLRVLGLLFAAADLGGGGRSSPSCSRNAREPGPRGER